MKIPEVTANLDSLQKTFPVNLPGGLIMEPSYLTAGAIVALLFLLILTLGQLRHRLLHWHMKGFAPGILFGIIITLIFEGFALVGGHTIITEILGWKNAPKPISVALDSGKNQLAGVLGVSDVSLAKDQCEENLSAPQLLKRYKSLDEEPRNTLKDEICSE